MDTDPDGRLYPWIIAFVLLVLAAFFAVTETAFSCVSKNKIKMAAERGDSRARKAMAILADFDRAISTLLICTNIVHIAAASVVTVEVTRLWGLSAVSLSTLLTTVVVFFAGEMLPKSFAKKASERCVLFSAGPLSFLMKLLSPLSWVLTKIGQAASKLTKGDPEVSVTEEELVDMIEDLAEEGSLEESQSDLISSAISFGDITVESILTPRVDLSALDADDPHEEILAAIKASNHSRLPVYEESVDHIIGVLQIRKYMKELRHADALPEVRPLMDEVLYVHQSLEVAELLPMMTENKVTMAVILDNYGGTLGIVTVEDILEELVGEIWDEDDVVEEPVAELSDGSFLFDAEETVSDAFDTVEFEDPEEDDRFLNLQLGEWTYEHFSEIPEVGDSFSYAGLTVTVAEMEDKRILKLRLEAPAPEEGGEEA